MDPNTLTHDQFNGGDSPFALHDEPAFLCCCSILDETLTADQHLADCELQHFTMDFPISSLLEDQPACDTEGSRGGDRNGTSHGSLASKRRKHRESMARLRQKLRESIDTLQQQERQLSRTLDHSLANFQAVSPSDKASSTTDARQQLRQAYVELVQEQLALQGERRSLDATWLQKDSYERLVQRELQRIQAAVAAAEACGGDEAQSS